MKHFKDEIIPWPIQLGPANPILSSSESLFPRNPAFFFELCPKSFHLGLLIHFWCVRGWGFVNICPYAVCSTMYQVWRPSYASSCVSYPLIKIFIFKVEAKVTFVFLEVSCFKGLKSDLFISEETETTWWWQIYWLSGHHTKALSLQLKLPSNHTLNVQDNVCFGKSNTFSSIWSLSECAFFPTYLEKRKWVTLN